MRYMKRYIKNTIILAFAAFVGASCVKEISNSKSFNEGEDVSLSLGISFDDMKVVHVKASDDDFENEVKDLRVYIFSASDGKLIGYRYYGRTEFEDAGNSYDATLKPIRTKTGAAYIYGIANSETNMCSVNDLTNGKSALNVDELHVEDSELTLKDFLEMTYSRQSQAIQISDRRYLMSGFVNGGKSVNIVPDNSLANGANARIETEGDSKLRLYKTVSKNRLTISFKDPSDMSDKNIKFTPDYYEIYNVPQNAALIPNKAGLPDGIKEVLPSKFETIQRQVLSSNIIDFYLPENLQTKNLTSTQRADIGDIWKNREKKNENASYFTNAPVESTYILISGRYESDKYTGSVAYTIHLGDFSKMKTDFDVSRNYSYIYNMTISGVKNFIVEAKRQGDDSGSEGIVINSTTGTVFNVDCHYEARAMSFNRNAIRTLISDNFGYIIKVKTPFCESKSLIVDGDGKIYEATDYKRKLDAIKDGISTEKPIVLATVNDKGVIDTPDKLVISGEPDFSWVHFVRNTGESDGIGCKVTSYRATSDVCKFPGVDNTKNVFVFFRDLYKNSVSSTNDGSYFNTSGDVYVSCFIDENYYEHKNWTDYVNKPEGRSIYFASEFNDSSDGKSFYAEAKYAIIQNSIWSFYDADAMPENANPFGVESVSEDASLSKGGSNTYPNYDIGTYDDWNGYTAATKYQEGHSFFTNNYRAVDANGINTQDQYSKISYVCMGRNRDENGDGKISKDEIKWYLATIDQYKGIWAGEDILSADAKLVPDVDWLSLLKNESKSVDDYHYFAVSSSLKEGIYWAEEGASTSPLDQKWSLAKKVRCVRTLANGGLGLADPTKFYSRKDVEDGTEIDLYFTSMRPSWKNAVGSSLERDYNGKTTLNKLYNKFIVSKNIISGQRGETITNEMTEDTDVCLSLDDGQWRVPNQKELSVMTAVFTDDELFGNNSGYMWCSTGFTGKQYGEYKYNSGATVGFGYYKGNHMSIGFNNETGYVRCVRDVQD